MRPQQAFYLSILLVLVSLPNDSVLGLIATPLFAGLFIWSGSNG